MGEHDALFKRTFSVPEHAAAELRSVLPEVASALELDALELVAGSFVDEALASRHTDLLFSAPLRPAANKEEASGNACLVYFLFEHQSEPDAWMPFRVYEYFGRIWSAYLREHPDAESLPPIVGVVVHHGEGGWTRATSMQEIVHGIDTQPGLARFVPSFDFQLDDLSLQDDASLQRRPMALFARIALWLLRDGRNVDRLLDRLLAWGPLLEQLAVRNRYGEDVRTVVTYVLRVAGAPSADIIRQRVIEAAPHLEEAMTSAAEQLIQQGFEKGRAQGLQQGVEQGLQQGVEQGLEQGRRVRAQTLTRMLRKRFGQLSDEQIQRIEDATSEQLDIWMERILDADSVDQAITE